MPPQEEPPETVVGHGDGRLESTTLSVAAVETGGTVLGRYRLLEKIGEGGMGEVWLAEQKEPVRRRVAIKLIKAGMNTREVMARFESERQALALMDHPAIARVLDAGSTPQGMPWFAMEYVAGVSITAYCDNHRLTTRERLELFVRVCEGVQHAHQKAIIHRDLKPSNILVTEVDGRPVPRIIDFGVAKALAQKLTSESLYTHIGTLIGTLEYMSPEQALSSGEDIDTRSDIYSLGIILYELLAGAPPLELRKAALDEFLRKIREDDAPKPSTRLRAQDPSTSTEIARKRQTEPPMLIRQIRGELDAIALKALEKDRSRRYASATDFAADIGRYLRNEPVVAVAPSLAYRTRKFARRYRAGLVVASAFALVLIVATFVSIRQSIRARRAAAVAQAVNNFLENDLLAQASANNQSGPSAKPNPNITVRTVLDRAAQRIDGKFPNQPEVEVALRTTIGAAYDELGLYAEAREQLERALETGRRTLGPDDPRTLFAESRLGRVAYCQGRYPEAEALESHAMEEQKRVLGLENPDTLNSMDRLAAAYSGEGKYAQAEKLDAQTLEIRKRVLGPENPGTLQSVQSLATDFWYDGKYAQAEALFLETLQIEKRVLGPEHPVTLNVMTGLASVYRHEARYTQAETLDSKVLEIQKRVLGPDHPDTLNSMEALAFDYLEEGKYTQAETLASQTLESQKRVLGPEHPNTLQSMVDLATDYRAEGKYAQAETLDAQTLEIRRRVLGTEHPDTLWATKALADDYLKEGKYAQAAGLFSHVLEAEKRVGPENPRTADTEYNLGCVEARQGHKDRAIALLSDAVDHGLAPADDLGMAKDTDLTSLHNDPRWPALIAHAKKAAQPKTAPAHASN